MKGLKGSLVFRVAVSILLIVAQPLYAAPVKNLKTQASVKSDVAQKVGGDINLAARQGAEDKPQPRNSDGTFGEKTGKSPRYAKLVIALGLSNKNHFT